MSKAENEFLRLVREDASPDRLREVATKIFREGEGYVPDPWTLRHRSAEIVPGIDEDGVSIRRYEDGEGWIVVGDVGGLWAVEVFEP